MLILSLIGIKKMKGGKKKVTVPTSDGFFVIAMVVSFERYVL